MEREPCFITQQVRGLKGPGRTIKLMVEGYRFEARGIIVRESGLKER